MKFPFNSEVITKSSEVTNLYLEARREQKLPENWLNEDDENIWCIRQQIIAEVYFR